MWFLGQSLLAMTCRSHLTSGQNEGCAHKSINCKGLFENPITPVLLQMWWNSFFKIHFWRKCELAQPMWVVCLKSVWLYSECGNSTPRAVLDLWGPTCCPFLTPLSLTPVYPVFLWLGKAMWCVLAHELYRGNLGEAFPSLNKGRAYSHFPSHPASCLWRLVDEDALSGLTAAILQPWERLRDLQRHQTRALNISCWPRLGNDSFGNLDFCYTG